MSSSARPLIGISGCSHTFENGSEFYKVGEKYVTAIVTAAGGIPVMIPPIGDRSDFKGLLDRLDGVFFTGSPSMIEPHHYKGADAREGTEFDPNRDATTLPLLRLALDGGIPIFCVCRGHQELNVALGGTLYQHVHDEPGMMDHRGDKSDGFDGQYRPAHDITIQPGGLLERIYGSTGRVKVNTVHEQAIHRPADRLRVEATTDDGLIEAVSVADAKAFALSVQWHPEHRFSLEEALNRKMFEAFGEAAAKRLKARESASASRAA